MCPHRRCRRESVQRKTRPNDRTCFALRNWLGSAPLDLILDCGGGLALAGTEVVELGAANRPATLDLDFRDTRGVDRENALDTLAVGNTANGEIFIDPRPLPANHDTGINLDALLVAFNDAGVDLDGVSDIERVDVGFELFFFYGADDVHFILLKN